MKALSTTMAMFCCAFASTALAQTFSLKHTFLNPTPEMSDEFGVAVAAVGNNILIGARSDNAGTAYLFNGQTGALLLTLPNPTPVSGEQFGAAVAGVGDNILIGAPNANAGSGEAYLFDGTTGALLYTFSSPNPTVADQFGYSVAAVGNNVLIGAPFHDTGANDAGAAYLFDGASGALLFSFLNPNPGLAGDNFGSSVAGAGDNALIGAPNEDFGVTNAGAAYLFDGATGTLLHTFQNPTPAGTDQFGASVAGLGNNLLVGAPLDDSGASNAGAAYLFDGGSGALLQTFLNPVPGPSSFDQFSFSVAAFGSNVLVVVGTPLDDTDDINSGTCYLFNGSTGALIQTIANPTPDAGDFFGRAVAAAGSNIIIGAPLDDDAGASDAGAAYLFSSNAPPVADAGDDQTVECTSPSGAIVTLDGAGSSDPDDDELTYTWRENGAIIAGPTTDNTAQVTLALGSYTIELTADDGNGGTDTDEVIVDVVDTTPPVITLQPEITLWPPFHQYKTVDMAQLVESVSDACDANVSIDGVVISSASSDELEDAPPGICLNFGYFHLCLSGDGSTENDIVIAEDCQSVKLRAERNIIGEIGDGEFGNGRVYTVNLQVSDASGNEANVAFKAAVPLLLNYGSPVDDGPIYTVTGNCGATLVTKAANGNNRAEDEIAVNPNGFELMQNYPNPFNPETQIRFELPQASHVEMRIFNSIGKEVRTLASGDYAAGIHQVKWDAMDQFGVKVPSGLYFYQIVTPHFREAKRMLLTK